MRASDTWRAIARTIALGSLVGGSVACVRNPAPKGWLAPAREAQSDPYGAWIVVTTRDGGADVSGEFLGFERDSVFVLLGRGAVVTIPVGAVRGARVAFFDSQWYGLAAYTGALAVATISNGFGLMLTMPSALIVGSVATASQSRAPIVEVDEATEWHSARKYARFPAALPDPLPRTLPAKGRR